MNFLILQRHRRPVLAGYVAAVLILTLAPLPEGVTSRLPWWFDKVVHTGLFACLAALLAWRPAAERPGVRQVLGPVIALAGSIELAQSLLPYRTGEVWDFVWGVVGGVAGYLAMTGLGAAARTD